MIAKQNRPARRILTFPAVQPCESINPSTLLTSLTNLALQICDYKSKSFSANARNAREIIRLINNLTIFLEEIRTGFRSDQSDSVVLSLSELHLTLQKVLYLLEDCTREDARLWMLMMSERVANHFQVLVQALSASLDVLPLRLLDVPSEVKELIELVTRQAHKSRFQMDPNDELVIKDVFLLLNQFENGVVPDRSNIKRVLDYIGVQKWSDCNKELKFMDAEIGFLHSNEKRSELSLLSSLMGFLSYSRCVVFDSIDTKKAQQQQIDGRRGSELLSCLNSDDFRCPISLEVMKEPVTIETGHTYDRSSILKWFRSGNPTCPKTGKRLGTTELVPNLVLKELIQQYCFQNGIPFAESKHKNRDITRTVVAGSLAAEGAMRLVSDFLAGKFTNGDNVEINKAAYEIRILSKANIFNQACFVEAGVIPYLLKLLLSKDSLSQENAIAGLLNLSKHSKSKALIVENGGLELIVEVLKKGLQVQAKQHAAATLFYLASVKEYRKLIGEITEAIPALVNLISEGHDHAKKNSLVSIYMLLMHPDNLWRVLATGAVPLLLNLLTSCEREGLVTDSLAVLAKLAEKQDGAKVILRSVALTKIVRILDSSNYSRATKEQCVALLLGLCINGGTDVVAHLVKSPSHIGSLYSQLSEGTARASKKAGDLIRILHGFYERNLSGSKNPILPQERFIHVW